MVYTAAIIITAPDIITAFSNYKEFNALLVLRAITIIGFVDINKLIVTYKLHTHKDEMVHAEQYNTISEKTCF